jgi:hypothetical protein
MLAFLFSFQVHYSIRLVTIKILKVLNEINDIIFSLSLRLFLKYEFIDCFCDWSILIFCLVSLRPIYCDINSFFLLVY